MAATTAPAIVDAISLCYVLAIVGAMAAPIAAPTHIDAGILCVRRLARDGARARCLTTSTANMRRHAMEVRSGRFYFFTNMHAHL